MQPQTSQHQTQQQITPQKPIQIQSTQQSVQTQQSTQQSTPMQPQQLKNQAVKQLSPHPATQQPVVQNLSTATQENPTQAYFSSQLQLLRLHWCRLLS